MLTASVEFVVLRWRLAGSTLNAVSTAGFTGETLLYRQSLPEFLQGTGEEGVYSITGNSDPSEALIDVYAQGHITLAIHVGIGLTFVQSADNEWVDSVRTSIAVRLQDVLDQGGLIYPVESTITKGVWYLTFPEGSVMVTGTI
jgi:hypothetical protein